MKIMAIAATGLLLGLSGPAHAACTPVKSEVVSVGVKAARWYSERSLTTAIEEETARVVSIGGTVGPITKAMNCVPYPNLLGADEWRCLGEGKVCTR